MRIGQLEINGEIARGGMGVVYRAQKPDGQPVAVKVVLLPRLHSNARLLQRFHIEVKTLARLSHANIVRVHYADQHEGRPYMVMDLVEGESVADRLGRSGPLPPATAADIAHKLARALEHAHRQKVLHRDVKPSNVLLTTDDEPLLTDFGLAKDLDASLGGPTQSGSYLGSPGYWSPEQALGQSQLVGAATDIYGAGATLYAMLTGFAPIEGDSLVAVMAATQSQSPVLPSARNPAVPAALDAICMRCLAKDPDARYDSAADLADALEDFLMSGTAPPNPMRAPLLALTAVALLVGAALLVVVATRGPDDPEPVPAKPEVAKPPAEPTEAERLADRAQALVDAGEFARGAELWAQVAALEPGHRPLERQGVCLLNDKDTDGGLAIIAKALEADPECAACYFFRAVGKSRQKKHTEALADIERSLKIEPGSFRTQRFRAETLEASGRTREALAALETVIAMAPADERAWIYRKQAYLHTSVNEDDLAIRAYTKAIAADPTEPTSYENRAQLLKDDDVQAAIDDYSAVLNHHPERIGAYYNRAALRRKAGDLKGAIADLRRVQEIEPKSLMHTRDLIDVLLEAKDDDGALAEIARALEINPNVADFIHKRGAIYANGGQLEKAEKEYEKALKVDPNHGLARADRGLLRRQRKDWQGAFDDLDAAAKLLEGKFRYASVLPKIKRWRDECLLKLPPDPSRAFAQTEARVQLLLGKKDFGAALVQIDKWLRAQSGTAEQTVKLLLQRADLLEKHRKDTAEALKTLNAARKLAPKDARILERRSRLYVEQGDLPKAIADLTRAIELEPKKKTKALYTKRAKLRERAGDMPGAISDMQTLVKKRPRDSDASLTLARMHVKADDPQSALTELRRSLKLNPGAPILHLEVARIHTDRREFAEAEEAIEAAMQINRGFGLVWGRRGDLRLAAGDVEAAIADYDKALELMTGPTWGAVRQGFVASRQKAVVLRDGG